MAYKDPEKQREFQRQWHATKRSRWLKDKKCEVCGHDKALALSKINRSGPKTSLIWSMAPEKRDEALTNCLVLCLPCRQLRLRRGQTKHGAWGYRTGCRCDICREAKKRHMREYRQRHPRKPKLKRKAWTTTTSPGPTGSPPAATAAPSMSDTPSSPATAKPASAPTATNSLKPLLSALRRIRR